MSFEAVLNQIFEEAIEELVAAVGLDKSIVNKENPEAFFKEMEEKGYSFAKDESHFPFATIITISSIKTKKALFAALVEINFSTGKASLTVAEIPDSFDFGNRPL